MRLGKIELLANEVHQAIIAEETMLTIYKDDSEYYNDNQNLCIAFTVASVHKLPIDEDDGFSLLFVL